MMPAVLGSVWTFGLIFALGREVDIVTVIVPIFVIVMGSADGLHFVTHFQEEAETTSDTVQRVESALSHVGVPMILTTISTAAGFASLLFTNVQPIQQLGLFTAIGIVFAGIISFFSLPALLSRLTIEAAPSRRAHRAPSVAGLKRLVKTRTPPSCSAWVCSPSPRFRFRSSRSTRISCSSSRTTTRSDSPSRRRRSCSAAPRH